MDAPSLVAEPISTARLVLEPLRVEHAAEAAAAFDDPALHAFTGGAPSDGEQLRARYERLVLGRSTDGSQAWLNWMARSREDAVLLGTVQATVSLDEGRPSAELAWVVATAQQRQGYAREASIAMVAWLADRGVERIVAHVHPDHDASKAVARALGMHRTGVVVDGEERWARG